MTDARTAALTRTAVTLAVMIAGGSPAMQAAASISPARASAANTKASANSARQKARSRQQERMRRLGRTQVGAVGRPERDLATIEAAERQTEPQSFGEQWQVVGCVGVHRGGVPS